MPTDSYSCKKLWAFVSSVFLMLGFTYNSFAFNPNAFSSHDSTRFHLADSMAAAKLVESLQPNLRSDVVNYAKRFLGSRYRYAGRDVSGFDCSGFTHFVMKNFAIKLSACSVTQSTQGRKIALQEVKSGDLVFFRRSSRSRISHVAMVVSNDERGIFIIHSTSRGVVVDNLLQSKYWRPKIYMARDVASDFTEPYAVERARQLLVQQAKLKSVQLDLTLLPKGLLI